MIGESSSYLLSADVLTNLVLLGSLPNGGLRQVRTHWLLELVRMGKEAEAPLDGLDLSRLDRFLHRLWLSGLAPGFEVMGNPSGRFRDLEDPAQVVLWRDLVERLADHYVERYGAEEVDEWNFESWNEPDHQ